MTDESYFTNSRFVTELTPYDFNPRRSWELNEKECCLILFYAPWCPHCKAVKETWEDFGEVNTFIPVYAFNCEKYKDHCNKIKEEMPGVIKGYPSILVYERGKPVRRVGERDRSLRSLIKEAMKLCVSKDQ